MTVPMHSFPVDALRLRFTYDPLTGLVYRKRDLAAGITKPVGTKNKLGYLMVSIGGEGIGVHRLAFALHHGTWPDAEIDHKDGDPANNRAFNLRLATHRQNSQNLKRHRSGRMVGATYVRSTGKWFSRVSVEGRPIHLGTFDTEAEAHQAYMDAVKIVTGIENDAPDARASS